MRMIRVPAALLDWLDVRRSVAIVVVVLGGYAAYVWRLDRLAGADHREVVVAAALDAAPIVGFLLAPALIGVVFGCVGWIDERVWTPWQGIYHAFDDHPVRVVEARDALWFASDDVHAALAIRRRDGVLRSLRTVERRVDADGVELLSNAGLVRLLGKSTDRSALRFLSWADGLRRVRDKRLALATGADDPPSADAFAAPSSLPERRP